MTALKPLETDWAWAAGLFEGEGSISPGKGRGAITLGLGSTDEDVVRRFHRIVGVGRVNGPYEAKGGNKPFWQWWCSTIPALEVINRIAPYLGDRRRARATEVISFRDRYIAWATRERTCLHCGSLFSPEYTKRSQRRVYCSKRCKHGLENARRRAAK